MSFWKGLFGGQAKERELLRVLTGGVRFLTTVSPPRLTETHARLSTAILLLACYGYTKYDPTEKEDSGNQGLLTALSKGIAFTQRCLQLKLIGVAPPLTLLINDLTKVTAEYEASTNRSERETLSRIPEKPSTAVATSGTTTFEITDHMLGISLLKDNALSKARDMDIFNVFGGEKPLPSEFLTIYATGPGNHNRYTGSPSDWSECRLPSFTFKVERSLLPHLQDRLVTLFLVHLPSPYGLRKEGCIIRI